MTLILVRHGQTEANARGLLLGRSDPPLTPAGERQAKALAAALPRPSQLVSSPLLRARQTAAAFAARAELDDRWIEMDYGTLDTKPAASVPEDVWRRWHADADFVPAGGESVAAVARRVAAACHELGGAARDHDVIVVSHVSPVKAAVTWALGVDPAVAWRMWLDDAAVCQIRFDGESPVLTAFNHRVAVP